MDSCGLFIPHYFWGQLSHPKNLYIYYAGSGHTNGHESPLILGAWGCVVLIGMTWHDMTGQRRDCELWNDLVLSVCECVYTWFSWSVWTDVRYKNGTCAYRVLEVEVLYVEVIVASLTHINTCGGVHYASLLPRWHSHAGEAKWVWFTGGQCADILLCTSLYPCYQWD